MAETKGMAEIQTRYPVTSGLTAGTTKQKGRKRNLVPKGFKGKKSIKMNYENKGVDY